MAFANQSAPDIRHKIQKIGIEEHPKAVNSSSESVQ